MRIPEITGTTLEPVGKIFQPVRRLGTIVAGGDQPLSGLGKAIEQLGHNISTFPAEQLKDCGIGVAAFLIIGSGIFTLMNAYINSPTSYKTTEAQKTDNSKE